ncbi:phosphomevalonate kinase [Kwoniella newhampshirensis]|uniref:Phosphomevalonate kinase n=1 Tax=Kwoniella newhampshirensis TaxID=1651941 RepID=A0AAW0YNZ9_9TREE
MSRRTVISSPGKVLLAGGYLVLDRRFSGLVVATSSRFYSCVSALPPSNSNGRTATISVRAGQFPSSASTWIYKISLSGSELVLEQDNEVDAGKNKFIAIALIKTLELAHEKIREDYSVHDGARAGEELLRRVKSGESGGGLNVIVLADNDFYSQREQLAAMSLPPRLSSLSSLTPFTPLPRPIPQTNKTGLGSSAALVTSLVASLLSHLSIISLPTPDTPVSNPTYSSDLQLVHSLAQYAHCLAQGKVGSGFDVSSAVFGTHLYRRFSPSVLTPLMIRPLSSSIHLTSSATLLPALDPDKWDGSTTSFRLPRGLRLILADVDAGTDTPSFVGKVLEWKKRDPEKAKDLWEGLDKANMQLEELLSNLVAKEAEEDYEETLRWVSTRRFEGHAGSEAAKLLIEIRATLFVIREYLREMSELSGVPIEPPEQTRLLDASSDIPGVLGGGVPGAGGYDAIFLLTVDTPAVISAVDDLWSTWTEMSVCPLMAKQSDGGLKVERVENVKGLEEALARK